MSGFWDAIGPDLTRILPAIDITLLHLSAPLFFCSRRSRASEALHLLSTALPDDLRTLETRPRQTCSLQYAYGTTAPVVIPESVHDSQR